MCLASLPLTSESTNVYDGRAADRSMPHASAADYAYNPAEDRDGAPTRDDHRARQHSMEMLINKLLASARDKAPHFWTHAHRYVASDSVWCEQQPGPESTNKRSSTPATCKEHELHEQDVLAPDVGELLFPAQVLDQCSSIASVGGRLMQLLCAGYGVRAWYTCAGTSNNVDPLVSGFGQIYLTVKYI